LLLQKFAGFSGVLALACQVWAGFLVYVSGLLAFNVLDVRGRLIQRLSRD